MENREFRHQLSFKFGLHMWNYRTNTDEELMEFFGWKIKPSAEMIIAEMARLEKKMQAIYKGGI